MPSARRLRQRLVWMREWLEMQTEPTITQPEVLREIRVLLELVLARLPEEMKN